MTLFTPSYGACGQVTINGVVLPATGDTVTQPPVWIWGDGSTTRAWFPASHEYAMAGTFQVQVTATSVAGASITASTSVAIAPIDPLCMYDLRIKPETVVLRDGVTSAKVEMSLRGPAGEIVPLANSQVQFTSSNPALVQVDATGTVRSIGFGEATISARPLAYPRTAAAKVIAGHLRIEPPLLVLSMTGARTAHLEIDAAAADGTAITPSAANIIWSGGNVVASVDATGLVTALRPPANFAETPYIRAQVNGLSTHNAAAVRVLPDSTSLTYDRIGIPVGPRIAFDIVDTLQGFDQRRMFVDYDVARITDLAYGIEQEASGLTPNSGDLQYLVNDIAHEDGTRPCGLSGNPLRLGSSLDGNANCLRELGGAPAWGIYFHEMGHNFTLASRRFSSFANARPGGLYTEGLASAMGMYVGRTFRARASEYGLSTAILDSILASHLVWWHPGATPSLDAYVKAGAAYATMTPDVLADMLLILMDQYGYEFYRRFLACFLPADVDFPFAIETEAQQATLFVAALSAAVREDLRGRFRGTWGFPIDDAYHAAIHPQLVQWAAHADVSVAAPTVPVVEYYNAALDHYFVTWVPDEIAKLDAGTVMKGWSRTGQSFKAFTVAQAGASPVCRFYIPPALGNSHFFGRGTAECAATGQNNPSFVLEDPAFMQMFLPMAGVCPAGTAQVYRVFSNRPDANHRYMTDKAVRSQMVAHGWLVEGDGPDAVVMCAPQ